MRQLLLAAALLTSPAMAGTPAVPAPAPEFPSARQAAAALAQTVAPREIMIPLNLKWAEKGMEELPKLNAESGALEREYPGIHQTMWLAAKDEVRAQLEKDIPDLWRRLERLYVAEMTESEIRALLNFYATPTGQRLIAAMYGNSDLQPMIESMATSGDGNASEQSFKDVTENAKRKAIANANIEPKDILPLMSSLSLPKMRAIGQKVQQAALEWVNEDDAPNQERIDKLMIDAADRFMKASKARSK